LKVTFLVGPEVTPHFFRASPSEIDFGVTAKIIVPVLGPGVLFGVDLATRNEQIRFCIKAIKPARLQRDVHSMVRELEVIFFLDDRLYIHGIYIVRSTQPEY
jgi:sterol 14-demethylase